MEPHLRLGIVGAGGYARAVTELILASGALTHPPVRLVAVAEPAGQLHAARLAELRQQGVATHGSYDDLLDRDDVEAVWLPVPIGLHRPFTERALAAGKAVLCEKPAAGCVQDVDAMIAARDRAGRPVAIGYQNLYEPATKLVQDRLRAGAIGAIRSATVMACWPRSEQYYHRNDWAGKFQHDEVWVMDSPPNNALAHYLQLALFLLAAAPVRVEAELYRALPVENFDTISARVTLADGVPLLVLMTHACRETVGPQLTIHGTAGRVDWLPHETMIQTSRGREVLPHADNPLPHLLERFARLVRTVPDDTRCVASLEIARAQTVVVNGASAAAPIVDVPRAVVDRVERDGQVYQAIREIEAVFAAGVATGQMLHESKRLPFTRPAEGKQLAGYARFDGPRQA